MLYKVIKIIELAKFRKLKGEQILSDYVAIDEFGYIYEYWDAQNPFHGGAIDRLLFPEDYKKIEAEEEEFKTMIAGDIKDLIELIPEGVSYKEIKTETLAKIAKYASKLKNDASLSVEGVIFANGKIYATDKWASLGEWDENIETQADIAIARDEFVGAIENIKTKTALIASWNKNLLIREDKIGSGYAAIFRSHPKVELPSLKKFVESTAKAKYRILVSKDELSKVVSLFDYETEFEFNNGLILRNGDMEVKIFRALLNDNEKASNYTSMPIKIHFDAKLLRNTLSCIDNKQNIFIELVGELEPIVIKAREAKFWIMPMRP